MCHCSSNVACLYFLALFCELRDSQCQACSWTEPQRQIILQIAAMNGNINSKKSFWWLVSNVLCVSDYVREHYTHNFAISQKKEPDFRHVYKKRIKNYDQKCPQVKVLNSFVSIHIWILLSLSVYKTCVCLCPATYTYRPTTWAFSAVLHPPSHPQTPNLAGHR